jgi:SAM-dependent methyltransferase
MSEQMKYSLNTTKVYHTNQLNTLGWELTVCNALYPEKTPIRRILAQDDSYGHLLYEYLNRFLPINDVKKIIEIGGGYGYLMKDFLDYNRSLEPYMLDISPHLLRQQKETLKGHRVVYREEDFLETDTAFLQKFDMAILNENLGDFPTLVNLDQEIFQLSTGTPEEDLGKAIYFFERYQLERPPSETFHFNLGALQALEKFCASGIPHIFLGEHSCEAKVPEGLRLPIHIGSTGTPEKISLKGHDEYSIQFSYLQKVAETLGYEAIRGPFADFISFTITEELWSIMASQGRFSDDGEIICQFIEDLYKYEYLILVKTRNR